MSDKDFDLLIKMLGMTSSDNENQALVALRKANDLAAKLGGWDAILRGKVKITVLADPFASMNIPKATTGHYAPMPPVPPTRPVRTPPQQPKASPPPTQPPPQPRPIPNRYEGTCTTCRQKVLAGGGLVYRSGDRWLTRHHPSQCPSAASQRKAFTTDDLQL